jgi:hypothetical protein
MPRIEKPIAKTFFNTNTNRTLHPNRRGVYHNHLWGHLPGHKNQIKVS